MAEKTALIVDERTYAQQLDLLRFQVSEISGARLRADEEPEVEQEYRRASNAAKLLELCRSAADLLAESDTALLAQAGVVGRNLQDLRRLDSTAAPLVDLHGQVVALLQELQTGLSHYADRVEIEPDRLQELEQRLNLIHSLKLKYGSSLAEVITFGEDARRKLDALEQRDEALDRLNSQFKALDSEIIRVGQLLTNKRRSIIPKLAKAVSEQLSDLGFKKSRFDVALETTLPELGGPDSSARGDGSPRLRSSGLDTIEFQFAPNPGEPARDLRAIASSGELARVMLALKTVLAAQDQVPVLVFDEVDANVGGETANSVGQKMRQIAQKRQVICITHLPQVAAPASAHYVANKQVNEGRTTSAINLVEKEDRVTELARMLGGQTDAARKHARALLKAV
jgi:DNA repair protein RecN (Recombination protein N)